MAGELSTYGVRRQKRLTLNTVALPEGEGADTGAAAGLGGACRCGSAAGVNSLGSGVALSLIPARPQARYGPFFLWERVGGEGRRRRQNPSAGAAKEPKNRWSSTNSLQRRRPNGFTTCQVRTRLHIQLPRRVAQRGAQAFFQNGVVERHAQQPGHGHFLPHGQGQQV